MKGQLRLLGGRKLLSPASLATRPTTSRVREALMNILKDKLIGSHWLDLCSGSGVISCEVLQKGAERVLAIEKDKKTAQICKKNLDETLSNLSSKSDAKVICSDVLKVLNKGKESIYLEKSQKKMGGKFDFVYLDPPYKSDIYSQILESLINGKWLKKECIVICEHSSNEKFVKPSNWLLLDKRLYGNTALILISPPRNCFSDTDSTLQQKGQVL